MLCLNLYRYTTDCYVPEIGVLCTIAGHPATESRRGELTLWLPPLHEGDLVLVRTNGQTRQYQGPTPPRPLRQAIDVPHLDGGDSVTLLISGWACTLSGRSGSDRIGITAPAEVQIHRRKTATAGAA